MRFNYAFAAAALLYTWGIPHSTFAELAGDALSVNLSPTTTGMILHFKATKQSSVPLSSTTDQIYLWQADENGYPYYMIGTGEERRENLWVGVGHAENTGLDYLIVGIRNLQGQFGQSYPQHLILNFLYNGQANPGQVEDGGLGIYPERTIAGTQAGVPGVENIKLTSSMYELSSNNFSLRFNFKNDFYALKNLKEQDIALLGDGEINVKLRQAHNE